MRGPFLERMEETTGGLPLQAIIRTKIEQGISARSPNQGRHFFDTMRACSSSLSHTIFML
jgi:hypothetical protein